MINQQQYKNELDRLRNAANRAKDLESKRYYLRQKNELQEQYKQQKLSARLNKYSN